MGRRREGVGRKYVYRGKVNRGRCDLEESGFKFREHTNVADFRFSLC